MSRYPVFLALLALIAFVDAQRVCNSTCKCFYGPHSSKVNVNCSLVYDQVLHLSNGDLPDNTDVLVVNGGEALVIESGCMSRVKDISQIYMSGIKFIQIKSFAAVHLHIVNLSLDVRSCKHLEISPKAFNQIEGPLIVNVSGCNSVTLGSEAFSWLQSIDVENVYNLEMRTAAFALDPTATNVGEHGPGMSIRLRNISSTDLPDQVFGASAAMISMEKVFVETVHAGAFSANTYNIVMAINCTFYKISGESFASKSLINNLHFSGCRIVHLEYDAIKSAIALLNFTYSRFEYIETGAINATVVAVVIIDSVFNIFNERGFEFSSWSRIQIERNLFDELAPNAIVAPGGSIHELSFVDNEIEKINPGSIGFIGEAFSSNADNVIYQRNYFGQPCNCNFTSSLAKGLNANSGEHFEKESYCTIDKFFARCFNIPDQNMLLKKFYDNVCTDHSSIQCKTYTRKELGAKSEIKNPRFPHKKEKNNSISDRNKKVIGIVIVTVLGCVIIVLFITFIRWMRYTGYCVNIKNFILSSNSSCGTFCDRLCICRGNNGMDNARSISQLSVNEYSERHQLNELRVQDVIQETAVPNAYTEDIVATETKTTQTLPEELTKELLENLKEKLDDPENYVEAREMIEHLYELIKVEENCNKNFPTLLCIEENIYELPFQNTTSRIGKNKKQMISIGTRTPSLDKLMPLSPYNRQTALAHEYFEPKDFAVHLYAEIANCDKDKRTFLGAIPDVVAEQAVPRGPYLRAVRNKMSSSASSSPLTIDSSPASLQQISTIKSNKSTASLNSGKMINRPLPKKPVIDPGEGTSRHG